MGEPRSTCTVSTGARTGAPPPRCLVFVARPAPGAPVGAEHFALRTLRRGPYRRGEDPADDADAEGGGGAGVPPAASLAPGEVLVAARWLSVDPYLRCRFFADSGADYAPAFALGTVPCSAGIGEVLESRSALCARGDLLFTRSQDASELGAFPWAEECVFTEDEIRAHFARVTDVWDDRASGVPPTVELHVCGVPGLTAYFGVAEAAGLAARGREAGAGEGFTLVVSGAAGATGSAAGQIAHLLAPRCRVVGVCGSAAKAAWLVSELGFDGAVCYRDDGWEGALRALCPRGVDVYFDNVGGAVSAGVFQLMNARARVVLCGQIATYDAEVPYPPPLDAASQRVCDEREIVRERYLVLAHAAEFERALAQLRAWVRERRLLFRETVTDGLEALPGAFAGMMRGANIGKALVRIGGGAGSGGDQEGEREGDAAARV